MIFSNDQEKIWLDSDLVDVSDLKFILKPYRLSFPSQMSARDL
jgi:hypothetical protein